MVGELDGLARSDGLTGLPNRRPCREPRGHEVAMGRRSKKRLTIALRQAMTELD